MDSYKRSTLGTALLFLFSSYNVNDTFHMIFYLASYFNTAGLTWRAWVNLALSLPIIVLQGFALRSRFYALTRASALHDPVESKKNKRWILIYILARIFIYIYLLISVFFYLAEHPQSEEDLQLPEIGPLHITNGILQDVILLGIWAAGRGKKGSARKLLPFYQEQQNQFPTQQL